jgi:tRNA/tmRNA/rRNA uracil-C5-methylase (TrmA/RlmC/RlmD family)
VGKPPIEVTVGSLDASGDGLAVAADGTRHVVPGVLPGETALVRTRRRIRGKYWSQVVEILDPSPKRVDAPCAAYAMGCGGCQLQHLGLADQRDFKLDLITSRFASLGEVGTSVRAFGSASMRRAPPVSASDGRIT